MCNNPSHTVRTKKNKDVVVLPVQSLFLLPQDEMNYANLPDLGIFIRATMTKKFFTSATMLQNTKMYNMFTSGSKKGSRKKKPCVRADTKEHVKHWTEIVSNSWCTSLLQETIPCLNRYKRGFKHTYDVDSVDSQEVRACIQVMYGSLLKLYPRGSKTPIFNARVNIVCRIQTLLEMDQLQQMEFVKLYPSLIKLCLMEYCYNVFLDFFPVEYSLISTHPCMAMYDVTAKVMFDAFRRDVISTGLESWDVMESKAASTIERCMRMCKFKMNKNASMQTVHSVQTCNFQDPLWGMHYAHGDISVLSKIYTDVDKKQIAFANMIQSNIMTFALPLSIRTRQAESLKTHFGSCDFSMDAMRYFQICSTCVVNGKVYFSCLFQCVLLFVFVFFCAFSCPVRCILVF
jgi:hypothetical protein